MAVNIVLTAILRASVNQFLGGIAQATSSLKGMQSVGQALSKAFDIFMLKQFLNVLMDVKDTISGMIADLLETAAKWQQMNIGMAAVIASSNKITDSTGRTLSVADSYNRALVLSSDLMKKLRLDAALNVGTTEELASTFVGLTSAVSNTSKAGENAIEKTRKLSNSIVAASYIMGPMVLKGGVDQAVRETNELLQGRLTIINTFARALGITTHEGKKAFEEAKKTGTIYQFLEDRLKSYSAAQDSLSRSYEGLTSTLKDMFDMIKQQTAEFGFNRVNAALQELVDTIVVRLPDGTAELSNEFTSFVAQFGPIFDELMIPILDLTRTLFSIVVDNKDVMVTFVRLLVQMLALVLDLLNLCLEILRPILSVVMSLLNFLMQSLNVVIGLVRSLVRVTQGVAETINNWLMPVLQNLGNFINGPLRDSIQQFLALLGISTDMQKENAKKQEEAALAADTHAEALGTLNDEVDESNKKVKDNTQHWKNWISTLKAAYSNRFPSAAKSFLTMFGSGGTLSPSSAAAGAVPVNINLNGPDGSVSIPAQMTPQQLAQANRNGKVFSGSLSKINKSVTSNPAMRNGPMYQN